jgi:L-rhamnose mutarotase
MKKYCLTLDLKDDADLIAEYEEQHKAIWPEIKDSITRQASPIWKYTDWAQGWL